MRLIRYILTVGLVLGMGSVNAMAEVVAVVSAKNPMTTLTRNQLSDIFLGKNNRFPDGGPAVPIDQDEASPRRAEFYSSIVGRTPAQLKVHWSKIIFTGRGSPPQQVGGDADVKKTLANNPAAIGYIDSSAVDASVRVVKIAP